MLRESSKFLPNRTKITALRDSLFVIFLCLIKALTFKQPVLQRLINNEPQMLVLLVWRERILVVLRCVAGTYSLAFWPNMNFYKEIVPELL